MDEEIILLLKRLEDLGINPVELLEEQVEQAEQQWRLKREQDRKRFY